MRLSSFISFAGFVMLIAATYCPLFHPPLMTWNMYKAELPYGIVVLLVAIVGIIGVVFMQPKLVRLTAWMSLGLVILFYFLSLLKIHFQFNFIPFHSIEKAAEKWVKFKWGWWLLVLGPVLAILGALSEKPKYKAPVKDEQILD
jgi:hypothetical protein